MFYGPISSYNSKLTVKTPLNLNLSLKNRNKVQGQDKNG